MKSSGRFKGHEIVMGKDRELLSFSVDLRWLGSKLVDPNWWVEILRTLASQMNPFRPSPEFEAEAKENSLEIYSGIKRLSKSSVVKIFGGSLQKVQEYCILKNRFLVVYIEDSVDRKLNTICRKTLADNAIGNALNERFILYAGNARHAPTLKFGK